MKISHGLSIALPLIFATAHCHAGFWSSKEKNKKDVPAPPKNSVYLSHPSSSFVIGFEAMYMQPYGNLDYAAEAFPEPLPSPHWKIYSIDPDYHFGFDGMIGVIFHNTNSNLTVDWQHFHSSDSASKNVPSEDMIGPFFEIGPDAATYKRAHGRAIFHFDQIDLDYGVFVNLGNRFQTNLYGGVAFARIRETLLSKFSSPDQMTVRHMKVPSTFYGAGPQLGMDCSFRIGKSFFLTGEAVGSLFVGPQKNHTKYKSSSPALPIDGVYSPNKQTTYAKEKTQVVPGFGGKIGLSFCHSFRHYMIKLEAGYEAEVYINAIQSIDMGSEVITPPVTPDTVGVFARTFRPTLNNFTLAGPYLTLALGF